jgi:threonine dehydrogenase-like Zn-dependent dehydrogenase
MKTIMPDGEDSVFVAEVPKPELFENSVLCRVTHGVISAGTERGIINGNKGKTKEEIIKNNSRLGYTGAGIVEEVKGSALKFKKGDRVAFYGAPYVNHSEYVCVPQHLIYPIPEGLSSEYATFGGLGAIAMHGFRQGKLNLGEVCVVAGLGLIGNLCAQFALLAGGRVIVTDFEASRIELFKQSVPENANYITCAPEQLQETVMQVSDDRGADVVLLCMSTRSAEPMDQAISAVRSGGNIVVVGVLDIHVQREPFFGREANLTISRAAGPGRYDVNYEKMGIDYPYQYIRWTEGRNLQETIRLLGDKRINVEHLISQRCTLDDVQKAYGNVVGGKPALGFIIDWKVDSAQ